MIDGNVVAEFVWFELKENAAETKLRKYPWESNTSLINSEAIIKWTESEKYIDIRLKKKKRKYLKCEIKKNLLWFSS